MERVERGDLSRFCGWPTCRTSRARSAPDRPRADRNLLQFDGDKSPHSKFAALNAAWLAAFFPVESARSMPTHHLAIDLGAESGRVMLGTIDAGRIVLTELHRFSNTPVTVNGALTWNISLLFSEVKNG